MAPFEEITVTPTKLVSLERKSLSKLLTTLPAISQQKAVDGMAPKSAFWPIHTCAQAELAKIEDEGDRILAFFTDNVQYAELREGFVHTETGRALAHLVDGNPKPGDSLCYKVHEFMRIVEETEKNPPVHLRVGVNTTQFQYVENFVDYNHYQKVLSQVASTATTALKDAMKGMIYSLLVGGVPAAFVKNFYLDRIFGKGLQLTDETESKLAKELYDQNGKYVALCKNFAGQFKAKFKNVRSINPLYRTFLDPERKGTYVAEKPADYADENAVKTALGKRYIVETGAEKNKPHKYLTRDLCILVAIETITTFVDDLTRVPAVENNMKYDPFAASATKPQMPVRANKSDLVLFGQPHDMREIQKGLVGYVSPGGFKMNVPGIADLGIGGQFSVDGMLPGDFWLFDKRAVGIVPLLNKIFENFNKWDLVDQIIGHIYIKWYVFCEFAGVQIYMSKWIPNTNWVSEFEHLYKNA